MPHDPSPYAAVAPTTVLGGCYRLLGEIGAGGMGIVQRAWDHSCDRYVVVKMPRWLPADDTRFIVRFQRELEVVRRLRHDRVVPILDVGLHGDTPYAVMPYLAGGSLAGRRPRRAGRPLPARSATLWHWLEAVADALDHVHAAGFVHRDVKPHNILFDGRGDAFLGDFGIVTAARRAVEEGQLPEAADGLTGAGHVLGTPEYVAPEVVTGGSVDGRTDQYALATVVYELLAGTAPLRADSPRETLLGQVGRVPVPLERLRPELPASLTTAVARGLAKRTRERFASCREFAEFALLDVPQEPPPAPRCACPVCHGMMEVPAGWAGHHGRCPSCRSLLAVSADLQSVVAARDRRPGAVEA